jgi:hypothetical protein
MIPLTKSMKKYGLYAKFSHHCAASRLVTQSQIDSLIANGLEVISCGALCRQSNLFGPSWKM